MTIKFEHVSDDVIMTSSKQMLVSMISLYLVNDIQINVLDNCDDYELSASRLQHIALAQSFVDEIERDVNSLTLTFKRINTMSEALGFCSFEVTVLRA